METIGYVIKAEKDEFPHRAYYRTVGTARMVASRYNNQPRTVKYFGKHEVFEITGIKEVEG